MRKFCKFFILGTLIVWLVVDIWLAARGGPTISRVVVDATNYYAIPIVGISMFIAGHCFWGQKIKE